MSLSVRFVSSLHGCLLGFYPHRFGAEFGVEMRAVFAEAAASAVTRGWVPLLGLLLRELRDWPRTIVLAHWQALV